MHKATRYRINADSESFQLRKVIKGCKCAVIRISIPSSLCSARMLFPAWNCVVSALTHLPPTLHPGSEKSALMARPAAPVQCYYIRQTPVRQRSGRLSVRQPCSGMWCILMICCRSSKTIVSHVPGRRQIMATYSH